MKKQTQKKEIIWNLVNATLAGALVFLGGFSDGAITWKTLVFALVAALIVVVTKFKDYWDGEKGEYTTKLFKFV